MKIKLHLIIALIFFFSCSNDDEGSKPKTGNKILSFNLSIDNKDYPGHIDYKTNTITVSIDKDLVKHPMVPEIEISEGATIYPLSTGSQIFKYEVNYTVTADNGKKEEYTVLTQNDDARITSFSLKPNDEVFEGIINHSNNTITVETKGLELNSSLIPELEIPSDATISSNYEETQNFLNEVAYTVSSESGEQRTYTVITENTPFSNEKKIISFQFNRNGEIVKGEIDEENKIIKIESYFSPADLITEIEISDKATISPDPTIQQNYNELVEYTVTAENGTKAIYQVQADLYLFTQINPVSRANGNMTKYYKNAKTIVRTLNLNFTSPNTELLLKNNLHSYELEIEPILMGEYSYFYISFPNNIVTADDYKLVYKLNGEIKSISDFEIDIVAENVPVINSSNQSTYHYQDDLILYGTNLVPGLRVVAHNWSIYQYNQTYISVNSNQTELTFPLTVNQFMFPYPDPYATNIFIFKDGRYGDSITVDFD